MTESVASLDVLTFGWFASKALAGLAIGYTLRIIEHYAFWIKYPAFLKKTIHHIPILTFPRTRDAMVFEHRQPKKSHDYFIKFVSIVFQQGTPSSV